MGEAVERQLRERISELEEALRQANEQLVPKVILPLRWRLNTSQHKLLVALYFAPFGLTHQAIFDATVNWAIDREIGNPARVAVGRLRKKVAPLGIKIINRWGIGWEMPPESKAIIKAALAS